MKLRKKIVATMFAAFLALSMSACGNSNTPTEPSGATPNNSTDGGSSAGDSTENNIQPSGDTVVLSYANWNLGSEEEYNMERRMIDEFNAMNTGVQIVLAEGVDYSEYTSSLNTLASSGNLPDIFALNSIPQAYSSKWLQDLTEVVEADSDWGLIVPAMSESVYIEDKAFALPFQMHMYGAIINKDIFMETNTPLLSFGHSLDDLQSAARGTTQPANGFVGIRFEGGMIDWLPRIFNSNFEFFSFDGEKYNLDSQEFIDGVNFVKNLRLGGYTYEGLSEDQKASSFNSTGDWEAWMQGEAAIMYDGTWSLRGQGTDVAFEMAFAGLPESNLVLIPDYLGVSATCEDPAAAYEFVKWMSFGKEGYLKRAEIAPEVNLTYFGMPMTDDAEVMEKFLEFTPVDGVAEAYQNLDKCMTELNKIVPGYNTSRWEALTGLAVAETENASIGDIMYQSTMADLNYSDYASQMNNLANQAYQEALNTMR